MNKNNSNRCRGIVVALKANFLIVELNYEDSKEYNNDKLSQKLRLLCTRRSKLVYQGFLIDVGDVVWVESIDYKNKRAVISNLEQRTSFLKRPAVSNVTLIAICISVEEPLFDLGQVSRFLITAEAANIKP